MCVFVHMFFLFLSFYFNRSDFIVFEQKWIYVCTRAHTCDKSQIRMLIVCLFRSIRFFFCCRVCFIFKSKPKQKQQSPHVTQPFLAIKSIQIGKLFEFFILHRICGAHMHVCSEIMLNTRQFGMAID